jgi:hypothetical protein
MKRRSDVPEEIRDQRSDVGDQRAEVGVDRLRVFASLRAGCWGGRCGDVWVERGLAGTGRGLRCL